MKGLVVAMLAFGVGTQESPRDSVELVSDAVRPMSFQPGQIAARVVTFDAPDGMRVTWPGELHYGAGVEAAGAPRLERALVADGRVRWTLTFPFTAWSVGSGTLEPFVLATSGERPGEIALGPVPYTVVSVLPGGTLPPPAPAAPPFSPSRVRWGLLPLVPLALAGLTGVGWWRAGRSEGASSAASVRSAEAPPKVDSTELLDRALVLCGSDPGRSVLLLAEVARSLDTTVRAGVTPSSTGREAAALIAGAGADELTKTVAWVLVAADSQRFGRLAPEAAEVVEHAARLGKAV